ncbi:MAG: AIR synthase-related protein, partial [Gammaproteobacteria bacterium]|nr:AIR synthase-related protein [Gammaproteobacteria bacterium]
AVLAQANYDLFRLLRERNLIDRVGFKDLGAGGVACASIELAEAGGSYGAEIDLELVPTGMADLVPSVILCSETQERFMWVVPPELVDTVLNHYNETFALPRVSDGARAAVIGTIRTDGLYVVNYQGKELVRAKVPDVTKGIVYNRPYVSKEQKNTEPNLSEPSDYNQILLKLLAHENIASRAPVFETYDKQVQGRTHIEAGWADAGVMQPFNEDKYPEEIRKTGIALSLDQNPRYNKIDAYWGAVNAVVESVRNITAVGANPVALTDCLCFGNPEKPEQMGEFVDSVRGIIDACSAIKLKDYPAASLPVIAGNVSLYNESAKGSIPPSPMISCLGSMPDVDYSVTYALKKNNSCLIMVGERKDECGGSVYYQLFNQLGSKVPQPDLKSLNNEIQAVSEAIQQGLILAAHDISEGGVAVALAEMSFKHSIGVDVNIPGVLSIEKLLFGESGGFILELNQNHQETFDKLLSKYHVTYCNIGHTIAQPELRINSQINLSIKEAKHAWEHGLRERLL